MVRLGEGVVWNVRVQNDDAGRNGLVRGDAIHVRWQVSDAVVLIE
jgi:hypothetical protein